MLAEPLGLRLAKALAERAGCEVETVRRPAGLDKLLTDLRVYSLFATGKVVMACETAALADRAAAAELVDEAASVLPFAGGGLGPREREAASRLLQALRLFAIDVQRVGADPAAAALPDWALQGGRAWRRGHGDRGRTKKQVEELRSGLGALVSAALGEGLAGFAEGDVAELLAVIESGLPPGHALVLVESLAGDDHPLVARLAARGAVVSAGRIEAEKRGGWLGLDAVAAELERETGSSIAREAIGELARRTLKKEDVRGGGGGLDPTSAGRLAAEYRKLAGIVGRGGRIRLGDVEENVEDRGDEDVWQLLDAVASGKGGEALTRLRRLIGGSDDPMAARLSFFSLLAGYCRQLTALSGLMKLRGVAPGERSFDRFKTRQAVVLQGEIPGGKNPLAGLHPFRLHRAYLAASRMSAGLLVALPWYVLEAELELKGESGDPDAALVQLVSRLAAG